MTNVTMKPTENSIGVRNTTRPRNIVNSQLKTLTPVGTAMIDDMIPKKSIDASARAHGEKVMQPDHERENTNRERRPNHRAVAEQALAAKGRDHFRKDAEGRQDQYVDFGMAPRPEQIDVHHLVAAGIVGEEMHAEVAIERRHHESRGQNRERGDDQHI